MSEDFEQAQASICEFKAILDGRTPRAQRGVMAMYGAGRGGGRGRNGAGGGAGRGRGNSGGRGGGSGRSDGARRSSGGHRRTRRYEAGLKVASSAHACRRPSTAPRRRRSY